MGDTTRDIRLFAIWVSMLLGLLVLRLTPAHGQADVPFQDERGGYLLRFAEDISWPNFHRQRNFYIEIVGPRSLFVRQFSEYCEARTVKGKPIVVSVTTSWSQRRTFHYPHLVYVTASAMGDLPDILRFFEDFPVLVVSERPYFQHGWMASFLQVEDAEGGGSPGSAVARGRWTFSLNRKTIEQEAGLLLPLDLHSPYTPQQAGGERIVPDSGAGGSGGAPTARYARLLVEQREVISAQQDTIAHQRDTIHHQRRVIETLSLDNYLLTQGGGEARGFSARSWLLQLHPGALNDAATLSKNARSMVAAERLSQSSDRPPLTHYDAKRTAPWSNRLYGQMVLLALGIISLSGVLGAVVFIPSKYAGGVLAPPGVYSQEAAGMGGGIAALGDEQLRRDSETQRAYNQQLELQIARQTREVEAMLDGMEKSHRLKNSFLANVSHEIRTPLNAIVGLAQFVASSPMADHEMKESLEIINENAFGLMKTVNCILMLAMLETGEIELKRAESDLRGIFDDLFEKASRRLQKLGRNRVVTLHHQRGEGASRPLFCDGEKVQIIMEHLLAQAIASTERGSIEFGYHLEGVREDRMVFYVLSRRSPLAPGAADGVRSPEATEAAILLGILTSDMEIRMEVAHGLARLMETAIDTVNLSERETLISFSLPMR